MDMSDRSRISKDNVVEGHDPTWHKERKGFDPSHARGLFIGISTYESDRFNQLLFAVDDAVDFAHCVVFELELIAANGVTLALSGEPVKEESKARLEQLKLAGAGETEARYTNLLRAVRQLRDESEVDGLACFFFAGHGAHEENQDYLIVRDSVRSSVWDTALKVPQVLEQLSLARAPRRIAFLDACRSRIAQSRDLDEDADFKAALDKAIQESRGQVILAAATVGGSAFEERKKQNGVFTSALLEGLRGGAGATADGFVTARTLAEFAQTRVGEYLRKNSRFKEVSLGIAETVEGPMAQMPLAVHRRAQEDRRRFQERRLAALRLLDENTGSILCADLVEAARRELNSDSGSIVLEPLLSGIETLDGAEPSQRALRDLLRERRDQSMPTDPAEDGSGDRDETSASNRSMSPPADPAWVTSLPSNRRLWAWFSAASLAVVIALLGMKAFPPIGGPALDFKSKPVTVEGDERPNHDSESKMPEEPTQKPEPGDMREAKTANRPGDESLDVVDLESLTTSAGGSGSELSSGQRMTQNDKEPAPETGTVDSVEPSAFAIVPARSPGQAGAVSTNTRGMRFRYVPVSDYSLGSVGGASEGVSSARLERGFWIAETETTQRQWSNLMGSNPAAFQGCGGDCPVESVNWWEVLSFANRLSEVEGLAPCYGLKGCSGEVGVAGFECRDVWFEAGGCRGYRLPTEAEWEVAARAGETRSSQAGAVALVSKNNAPVLGPFAWYSGNSGVSYASASDCSSWAGRQDSSSDRCGTHAVAEKGPNDWGLYDVLGNVWEWCYASGSTPSRSEADSIRLSGPSRVIRGGAWRAAEGARAVHLDSRLLLRATERENNVGFRLVRGESPLDPR